MVGTGARAEPREAPIGVFDSGLGGLTVVRALLEQLPDERMIYVGDTARVPYGPKSPDTVRRYADEIARWLVGEGVKAIVVACNTATAHALAQLQHTIPVPVIGVVEPGARAAVAATPAGAIGVIGTAGTIGSGAYLRAIQELDPQREVISQPCPLLVPLVEEGWVDHAVTRDVAREYLEPLLTAGVRSLVLGCTHYPLLKPMLAELAGPTVTLIDSADETARATAELLRAAGLATRRVAGDRPSAHAGANVLHHRFVASDAPDRFLELGRRFLGATLDRVEHVSFG